MTHVPPVIGAPSNARRAVRRRRQWLATKGNDLFIWTPGTDLGTIGGFFNRTTVGTYYEAIDFPNSELRLLRDAAIDEFRDNHFELFPGVSSEVTVYRTALLEPARTNLATFSEDFTNAVWTKSGATITPNESEAPDGVAASMDKLVESVIFEDHFVSRNHTIVAGAPAAVSYFVKASGRTLVQLEIIGNPTTINFIRLVVDLTDGSSVLSVGGTGVVTSAFVDQDINGSLRIALAGTVGGTDVSVTSKMSLLNDSALTPYTGDGVSGVNVWGGQSETGTDVVFASSYQRAIGAGTVARDFDHFRFVWPETLIPEPMSMIFRYSDRGLGSMGDFARLYQLGDPAAPAALARLLVFKQAATTGLRFQHDANALTSLVDPMAADTPILDIIDNITRLFEDGHLEAEVFTNGINFEEAEDLVNTPGLGADWAGDPSNLSIACAGAGVEVGAIALHAFAISTFVERPLRPIQPPVLDDLGFRIDPDESPDLAFIELNFDDVFASDVDADPTFVTFNDDITDRETVSQEGPLAFFGTPGVAFLADAFQTDAFS